MLTAPDEDHPRGLPATALVARPIDVHIGKRLAWRRENLGLCCRALSEKVQLSEALIQAFEAGHVRIGSCDLVLIAEALKVSISYFYSD